MRSLSKEYGVSKAFNDDELFAKITSLTYPAVGDFLNTYVAGTTPIPYETFLAKVGLGVASTSEKMNVFIKDNLPLVSVNAQTSEIFVLDRGAQSDFSDHQTALSF